MPRTTYRVSLIATPGAEPPPPPYEDCYPVILRKCVASIEGDAWRQALIPWSPDWPARVRALGEIPTFDRTAAGWVPHAQPPQRAEDASSSDAIKECAKIPPVHHSGKFLSAA